MVENEAMLRASDKDTYGFETVVDSSFGDMKYRVVRHKKTDVLYAIGAGGVFTLLVDTNGHPLKYQK